MTGLDAGPQALSGAEVAHLRHELRTPVNQIVGYCQMLLEDAQEADLAHRRPLLELALAAVREATAIIDTALPANVSTVEQENILTLYQSLHQPRSRIIEAMSALLHEHPGDADEVYIADVCRIRDAAERLLPTDRRRAEHTTEFSVTGMLVQ